MVRRRVLVTGGAGFLGSHLCERLLAEGTTSSAWTTSSPASRTTSRTCSAIPTSSCSATTSACRSSRGGRDLQPGLPGLAGPLPVQPGADHQDQRARRHQRARHGQARQGARCSRPRPARSTATPRCIPSPRATGATSIRSARAPATTRASAAPRPCSSIITASTAYRSASRGSSTPTARACTRTTAAWYRTSCVQALRGEPITIFGDGSQTRSFCYVDDLIEGFVRLMARPRRCHRARSTSAIPQEFTHARAGRAGDLADRLEIQDGAPAAARRRSRRSAAPTSRSPRKNLGWAPKVPLEEGLKRTIDYFRGLAS